MFQSFDVTSQKNEAEERIAAMRAQMKAQNLDAFIVPHADEHQNEYLPENAERVAWISGFTGSAGFVIVLESEAWVYTDGRYTLQVKEQTDPAIFQTASSMKAEGPFAIKDWAKKNMRIGLDPWLHTADQMSGLEKAVEKAHAELVLVDENPLDAIWNNRPEAPSSTVHIHAAEFAGTPPKTKLNEIGKAVREAGADAFVMTDPNSLCWAFNIRGHDVVHTPLVLGFAVIPAKGAAQIFLDEAKLDTNSHAYLNQLGDIHTPDDFMPFIEQMGANGASVLIDPSLTAVKIAATLENAGAKLIKGDDPCRLPRACKNKVERKGAIEAQKRDGAAMVSFLAWLDAQEPDDLDEIKIAQALEQHRVQTGERLSMPLQEISFDTISGSGPNGAIVHYRVNTETNRQIQDGDLVLIDSGGQYEDGTTDITRVVTIGEPTEEYRRHFTLVLKGMIAISLAKFPAGTRGIDLDVLARNALWSEGLDYAHGTGHGVGSFLGVHEGPQGIHRRAMTPFETGMIVSNEPGYYKEGSHGIRIENLVIVDAPRLPEGGNIEMHSFTTLTLCPIDRRLIDVKMLTVEEKRWMNAYHSRVRNELSKLIDDEDVLHWLEKATRRIKRV